MTKKLFIHYREKGEFTLTYFTFKNGTAFPDKEQRILYINYDLELAIKNFRSEYGLKGIKLERYISGENIKEGD